MIWAFSITIDTKSINICLKYFILKYSKSLALIWHYCFSQQADATELFFVTLYKFYFNEKELPTLNKKEVNIRVLLDRTTIEVFVDDGFSVLSSYAVPASDEKSIFIKSDKTFLFDKFVVNKLQSIWP